MVTFESLVCGNIVRRHARTFALASAFLPLQKRRATYALYAFCRLADDAVDRAGPTGKEAVRDSLRALRGQLDAANGHAQQTWIQAGQDDGNHVEVLGGLTAGQSVVVEGNYGVRIAHIVSREERLRTLF